MCVCVCGVCSAQSSPCHVLHHARFRPCPCPCCHRSCSCLRCGRPLPQHFCRCLAPAAALALAVAAATAVPAADAAAERVAVVLVENGRLVETYPGLTLFPVPSQWCERKVAPLVPGVRCSRSVAWPPCPRINHLHRQTRRRPCSSEGCLRQGGLVVAPDSVARFGGMGENLLQKVVTVYPTKPNIAGTFRNVKTAVSVSNITQ